MWTQLFFAPVLLLSLAASAQKVCDVKAYGAKGDGVTNDTLAIQKAIDACSAAGGGTVRLSGSPAFVSAPVMLKSHIVLEIAAGTTLEGSLNHDDYPMIEVLRGGMSRQSLLLAKNAEDITIRGGGVIDGRGQSWWPRGTEGEARPRLIVFDHTKHVLMENVTVQNSPSWQIMPYYSEDLTFRNMKILAPLPDSHRTDGHATDGRNTDGIDPYSSKHVLIDHVTIDTGDDNVAIKSGQPNSAGPDEPSEDIHIVDCTFLHGHGLSVGSEVSGGVKHVHAERVTFNGTTQGIRIKSGRDRGGELSDFVYKDITMENVGTAIQLTEYYGASKGTNGGNVPAAEATRLTPHLHDVTLENVTVKSAKKALEVDGLPEAPIEGVTLKNVTIDADKGAVIQQATVNSQGLVVRPKSGPAIVSGVGAKGSLK